MIFPVFVTRYVEGPTKYVHADPKAVARELLAAQRKAEERAVAVKRHKLIDERMKALSVANNDSLNVSAYYPQAAAQIDAEMSGVACG